MSYCARYRFILRSPIKFEEDTTAVMQFADFPAITLEPGEETQAGGQWVIAKLDGFGTEEEARSAGERLGDVLLVAGAISKLGIDVGFNRSTVQFFSAFLDAISVTKGTEQRAETHGLMVYEKDTVEILHMQIRMRVVLGVKGFRERLSPWTKLSSSLTYRQRNCAALINDSFFVNRAEAQFVLRISAVEALCEPIDRESQYLSGIADLEKYLAQQKLSMEIRTALQQTLEKAKLPTTRSAYLAKFRTLCSEREAKAFDELYRKRSKLLHSGLGRGELQEAANDALDLAVRVLEAEVLRSL